MGTRAVHDFLRRVPGGDLTYSYVFWYDSLRLWGDDNNVRFARYMNKTQMAFDLTQSIRSCENCSFLAVSRRISTVLYSVFPR